MQRLWENKNYKISGKFTLLLTKIIVENFDEIIELPFTGESMQYGIVIGSNTIVYVKAGANGSMYGYENKYLQIARNINILKYWCLSIFYLTFSSILMCKCHNLTTITLITLAHAGDLM